MSVIATVLVGVLLALWSLAIYKRLLRLRHRVQQDWRQVDVQLKRRHEVIPNLVTAVKGAMTFEREMLETVVAARQRAMAANGPRAAAAREDDLSTSVERLVAAVGERYPDLTVSQNVRALQTDLAATAAAIALARTSYNRTATAYNTALGVTPDALIAGLAGFRRAELFAAAEAETPSPTVERR